MTDSYGLVPCGEFNYIPKAFQKMSNQDKNVLLRLLINQPLQVHYNQYRLQKLDKHISTCGKYCCVRGLYPDVDEDEFAKIVKGGMKDGISTDEMICYLYEELKPK